MSSSAVETRPPQRAIVADEAPWTGDAPARRPGPRTAALIACLALLLVYIGLSFTIDPRGTLLADSGGKLATLKVMSEHGTLDPDVGYWAAADDPGGTLHPLRYTSQIGDSWVQATTLPMLYAALPLYELGGFRAVLLLPMLGAVLAALACRAIARRLGADDRTAWLAFWAIGLLTPVALYALSFWEHTLGLAAMLWAVALVFDALDDRVAWPRCLAVGALFGVAGAMRTEALVYFVTTMGVLAVALVLRRTHFLQLVVSGASAAAGLLAVLAANELFERATLSGSVRAARASGTVAVAADAVRVRAEGAVTSVFGVNGFGSGSGAVIGLVVVAAVIAAVTLMRSDGSLLRGYVGIALLVLVGCVYVARFAVPAFLPGLLVASPLAAAGIGLVWATPRLRMVAALALLPLPLIWATQFVDSQRFQWGNRFALTSGALLATAAVVVLARRSVAVVAVLGLALVVATFSVLFLVDQSHSIADGVPQLTAPPGALVVTTEAHLWREGGAFYEPGRRWLAAGNTPELRQAAGVAADHSLDRVLVVAATRTELPDALGAYQRTGIVDRLEILPHGRLKVVEYQAT